MTENEAKTKINEIRKNNLPGNKTEESTCDINCSYSNYVTEDDSNDIRAEFLENNRGETTEVKNYIIQMLSRVTRSQMSDGDQLLKIHMTKSNKHIMQIYKPALQTLITDKPLGNITEVNNVIYATALAAPVKLGVKAMKRSNNRRKEPTIGTR